MSFAFGKCVLVGLGALLLTGGKGGSTSGAPVVRRPNETDPPDVDGPGDIKGEISNELLARFAKAMATNDPKKMRAEAVWFRAQGYPVQAAALERAAGQIEAAAALPNNVIPAQRVLKLGMKGADVTAWQAIMAKDGFVIEGEDGVFGPATVECTKAWQIDHGLKGKDVDGMVGLKTRGAAHVTPLLGARILRRGSQGSAVKAWKSVLRKDDFGVSTSGQFDAQTESATKQWQVSHGIDDDGVVGPKTIAQIGKPKVASPMPDPSYPELNTGGQTEVASTGRPGGATGSWDEEPNQSIEPNQSTASYPLLASSAPKLNAQPLKSVDPDKWRTMRRGTAGTDVAEWQMVLNRDGFPCAMDGKFGPATEAATKQWQTQHGLKSDGVVGPNTRAKISANPDRRANAVVSGDPDPQWLQAPAEFRSVSPLPGIMASQVPTEIVPADRSLAARTVMHLFEAKPGDEDRELVAEFQKLCGLNPTGAYGPATALAFVTYGIVPPKPFYWPRKGLLRARTSYKQTLMAQSGRDAQRADEWSSAARV